MNLSYQYTKLQDRKQLKELNEGQQPKRSSTNSKQQGLKQSIMFNQDGKAIGMSKVQLLSYPYSSIGRIYNGDTYIGTGSLIGRKLILTAKHNLKNKDKSTLQFEVNKPNGDRKRVSIKNYHIKYQSTQIEDDYGIIQLEDSLLQEFGFLGTWFFKNKTEFDEQAKIEFKVIGCPEKYSLDGQTELKENKKNKDFFECKGIISINEKFVISYNKISTYNGQSGGPILLTKTTDNKNQTIDSNLTKYYIVGIHLGSQKKSNVQNNGVLLNLNMKIQINEWINQLGKGRLIFKNTKDIQKQWLQILKTKQFDPLTELILDFVLYDSLAQEMLIDENNQNIKKNVKQVQKVEVGLRSVEDLIRVLQVFFRIFPRINSLKFNKYQGWPNLENLTIPLDKQKDLVQSANKITFFDFSNFGIDAAPTIVTSFTNLEILNLSSNNLQNIPLLKKIDKVDKIHKIRILDLSNNKIKDIKAILQFKNLEQLKLASNKIKSVSEEIFYLQKLQKLDLSKNEISQIEVIKNPRQKINKKTILKQLNLSQNKLYGQQSFTFMGKILQDTRKVNDGSSSSYSDTFNLSKNNRPDQDKQEIKKDKNKTKVSNILNYIPILNIQCQLLTQKLRVNI